MIKSNIYNLIYHWNLKANRLLLRSSQTDENLQKGTLDQEDSIIYSVYEDAAAARAIQSCINDLTDILSKNKNMGAENGKNKKY